MEAHPKEAVGVTESRYHAAMSCPRVCLPVVNAKLIKLSQDIISEIEIYRQSGGRKREASLPCHIEEVHIKKSSAPKESLLIDSDNLEV